MPFITQVLFRSGVLNQLEAKRDELLSDRIIQLQSYCRGHLARKRLAQRRVQVTLSLCHRATIIFKITSRGYVGRST